MARGSLMVVSGFSGVGKGTVVRQLLAEKEGYCLSISCTTRAPREGEIDGVHYFFLSEEEFQKLLSEDGLLEHACYVGNYYGTPRHYVDKALDEGKCVILEIEVKGARQIRSLYPDAALVFIAPPSMEELARRLTGRRSETEEQIRERLERAKEEAAIMTEYDYILVNDRVEDCVEELDRLGRTLQNRTMCKLELAKELMEQAQRM